MITPPFLKPGDTIGIAASARKVDASEIEDALKAAKEAGFKTVLADNIYKASHQFSGNDEERASGINQLLKDREVHAIWCARGGYGSVRLLDKIDWKQWAATPKWICGFSDVTAIHLHLQQNLNMASMHSEMMLGFTDNTEAAHASFFNLLQGKAFSYLGQSHHLNRKGTCEGNIVGGNLSVLYSMLGSKTQPDTRGKILFLEDLDEYLYHVDRMMMALDRAGLLNDLAGLLIGGMSDMNDNAVPFGKTAEEIIADVTGKYDYPVAFGYPAGHITNNCAFVLGAKTKMEVGQTTTSITQHLNG
jgi:muramoyltetrapeptide carboxypeptidase